MLVSARFPPTQFFIFKIDAHVDFPRLLQIFQNLFSTECRSHTTKRNPREILHLVRADDQIAEEEITAEKGEVTSRKEPYSTQLPEEAKTDLTQEVVLMQEEADRVRDPCTELPHEGVKSATANLQKFFSN